MSTEISPTQISQNPTDIEDWWEPPMPPTDLIFDDGEPLETNRHRTAMNVLIDSVIQGFAERNDFVVGGNMFIYYSSQQAKNREFRGPDFFVVLDVDGSYTRQGWVVWEEGGRYPDVIIELMSPTTATVDLTTKKDLYERTFKTLNYFVYNPFAPNSLQGWHLGSSGRYQALTPNERGWLWCEALDFWVGTWEGTIQKDTCFWLRFYDQQENLVLLPEEAAQKLAEAQRHEAEAQRQRAERLAARLRELGENPDNF